jgi:hypothetical protein
MRAVKTVGVRQRLKLVRRVEGEDILVRISRIGGDGYETDHRSEGGI